MGWTCPSQDGSSRYNWVSPHRLIPGLGRVQRAVSHTHSATCGKWVGINMCPRGPERRASVMSHHCPLHPQDSSQGPCAAWGGRAAGSLSSPSALDGRGAPTLLTAAPSSSWCLSWGTGLGVPGSSGPWGTCGWLGTQTRVVAKFPAATLHAPQGQPQCPLLPSPTPPGLRGGARALELSAPCLHHGPVTCPLLTEEGPPRAVLSLQPGVHTQPGAPASPGAHLPPHTAVRLPLLGGGVSVHPGQGAKDKGLGASGWVRGRLLSVCPSLWVSLSLTLLPPGLSSGTWASSPLLRGRAQWAHTPGCVAGRTHRSP